MYQAKVDKQIPAPPPPNVPELDEASDKPLTNRQMVLIHQQRATCASCHVKMDAIGFGLENFDTIGRWRDTEKVGNKQVPIQSGGKLPSGEEFANVNDLKKVLLGNEHHLAEQLTESLLSYALGRTVEFSDADDVEAILAKLKKGGQPSGSWRRIRLISLLIRRASAAFTALSAPGSGAASSPGRLPCPLWHRPSGTPGC